MKNLLLLTFLLPTFSIAQNLVPNFSFETKGPVACGPNLTADFNAAYQDWRTPSQGTPDVFSTDIDANCWNFQPNSQYPGPIGLPGNCMPRSGHDFVGFLAYSFPGLNQREYVQVALDEPMVKDESYCVEFWISLNDSREYAVDKLGAYFSTTPVSSTNDLVLPYQPQVETSTFQSNSANWALVSQIITATDNWEYITIGNFRDDTTTNLQANPNSSGQPGTYGSYYFLDDVSVTACPSTALDPTSIPSSVQVFPNPAHDWIQFQAKHAQPHTLQVWDARGKMKVELEMRDQTTLSVGNWPRGVYTYRLISEGTLPVSGKLVLN